MTTYKVNYGDHKNCEYREYTKFPRQLAPCGITWVALEVAPNRVKRFDLSQIIEVVDPRLTGMDYCYPQPDPRTMDNILALTEVLNGRNPERQASRDLYTYQLYCEIADELAA